MAAKRRETAAIGLLWGRVLRPGHSHRHIGLHTRKRTSAYQLAFLDGKSWCEGTDRDRNLLDDSGDGRGHGVALLVAAPLSVAGDLFERIHKREPAAKSNSPGGRSIGRHTVYHYRPLWIPLFVIYLRPYTGDGLYYQGGLH